MINILDRELEEVYVKYGTFVTQIATVLIDNNKKATTDQIETQFELSYLFLLINELEKQGVTNG